MKPEEKELLIKDLCARLRYGVKLDFYSKATGQHYVSTLLGIEPDGDKPIIAKVNDGAYTLGQDHIKPYLRPMSSMTEEEKKDILQSLNIHGDIDNEGNLLLSVEYGIITLKVCKKYLGELNKRMFDVCHMIEKGLALEAPEGMYKS